MRLVFVYYFIRRNNLDLRDGQISAEGAQLYLQNYDEIVGACNVAKSERRGQIRARRMGQSER